jgi:hypothetical protein
MSKILVWSFALACAAQAQPGRGSIPNLTQQQAQALVRMNAELQPLAQKLAAARNAAGGAAIEGSAIQPRVDAVQDAEMALAAARAQAFAKIQSSPDRLAPDQVTAFAAMGAPGPGGGRGGATRFPAEQTAAVAKMDAELRPLLAKLNGARAELVTASLEGAGADAMRAKARAIAAAETAVAAARASAFRRLQDSPGRLSGEQTSALAAAGGTLPPPRGSQFTQPDPMDFNDHQGYVALFDGTSLKGWDGNPKFWRVEDGAIVGESTPENPSGNTYLVYRGVEAHDFTLKFEIKVEGTGGSGFQYRSKTGIPWLSPVALNVIANSGPVNLDWMLTGPQADFWPSTDYTGQFYTENHPMRIMAWRGQVVEGAGTAPRRLMGMIGDHAGLNDLVRKNDWNQYIVIARGGTFLHIVNGQLMAVMVDDDPKSINNQAGLFGIEIEATTKVSVRNIWVKKLN